MTAAPSSDATIIMPDSSHWAGWLDAALSGEPARRSAAMTLHARLAESARVPLLTMHHLEELLAIDDERHAMRRLAALAAMPRIAWFSSADPDSTPGSILDVFAAEAVAVLAGAPTVQEVRATVRRNRVATGPASAPLGPDLWIWRPLRLEFLRRNERARHTAAVRGVRFFDDRRTIAEISAGSMRRQSELARRMQAMRADLAREVATSGDRRIADPNAVALGFMDQVARAPRPAGISVRELLVATLVAQGLEPREIRDGDTLADLNRLALFRSRLRVVAPITGHPFATLRRAPPELFPHHRVLEALRIHGQKRARRPGSDINDEHLAAFAPYVDEIFVDRRTAEDFRRALGRQPEIPDLTGRVRKAACFDDIASP